jgi:hypothetical protein
VGRNSTVPWGNPRYTADLEGARQQGKEQGGSKTGCTWPPVYRVEWPIRVGVLLYKQLIRPTMDYACPIWRSSAHTHVNKVQVLQPKHILIATNYVSNRQVHEESRPHQSTDSER